MRPVSAGRSSAISAPFFHARRLDLIMLITCFPNSRLIPRRSPEGRAQLAARGTSPLLSLVLDRRPPAMVSGTPELAPLRSPGVLIHSHTHLSASGLPPAILKPGQLPALSLLCPLPGPTARWHRLPARDNVVAVVVVLVAEERKGSWRLWRAGCSSRGEGQRDRTGHGERIREGRGGREARGARGE